MKSEIDIKVRGYHLDIFAHVNNARYLEFLEEARWDYLEKNRIDLQPMLQKGMAFNVVNININYRRGAVLGDVLRIETDLGKIGNKSMSMVQKAFLKGAETPVADAEVTYVFIDLKTGKALPIGEEILNYWNEADS